jgi:hypothetical protein
LELATNTLGIFKENWMKIAKSILENIRFAKFWMKFTYLDDTMDESIWMRVDN